MKINSIRILRALAVGMVTYSHAIDLQLPFIQSLTQNFYFLADFGAIGVDVFFIISGFIISYVSMESNGFLGGIDFLKRRFIRIIPIYYLVSTLYIPVLNHFYKNSPLSYFFYRIRDTIFIIPILNAQKNILPVLSIGWTLSFEWLFYLIYFLIIVWRVQQRFYFLLLLVIGLFLIRALIPFYDFRISFFTNIIITEFVFGAFIYYIYERYNVNTWIINSCFIIGIIGWISNIFLGYGNISASDNIVLYKGSLQRVVLWGIPSALIVFGAIFAERIGLCNRLWNNRHLLLIGDASFSIYLIHRLLFYWLSVIYENVGFPWNADIAIYGHVLLAFILGVIFYKSFELPLLTTLKS